MEKKNQLMKIVHNWHRLHQRQHHQTTRQQSWVFCFGNGSHSHCMNNFIHSCFVSCLFWVSRLHRSQLLVDIVSSRLQWHGSSKGNMHLQWQCLVAQGSHHGVSSFSLFDCLCSTLFHDSHCSTNSGRLIPLSCNKESPLFLSSATKCHWENK